MHPLYCKNKINFTTCLQFREAAFEDILQEQVDQVVDKDREIAQLQREIEGERVGVCSSEYTEQLFIC